MMFTSLQPIPSFFLSFKHRLWYFKYLKWRTIIWRILKIQTIQIYPITACAHQHYHLLLLFETVFFQELVTRMLKRWKRLWHGTHRWTTREPPMRTARKTSMWTARKSPMWTTRKAPMRWTTQFGRLETAKLR